MLQLFLIHCVYCQRLNLRCCWNVYPIGTACKLNVARETQKLQKQAKWSFVFVP